MRGILSSAVAVLASVSGVQSLGAANEGAETSTVSDLTSTVVRKGDLMSQPHKLECDKGGNTRKPFLAGDCHKGGQIWWYKGDCLKNCVCYDDGDMYCKAPKHCEWEDRYFATAICKNNFVLGIQCRCVPKKTEAEEKDTTKRATIEANDKETTNPEIIEAVSLPHTYEDLTELAAAGSAPSCKKSKTNKPGIAGKCNNGKSVTWTSEDCSKNCRCDGKGLYCPAPKGCSLTGQLDAPTRFCAGHADFSCACSGKTARDVSITQEAPKPRDIPADDVKWVSHIKSRIDRWAPLYCQGKTFEKGTVATCQDGHSLRWDAEDCTNNCRCSDTGLICTHPKNCGETEHINRFCASNAKFACGCKIHSVPKFAVEETVEEVKEIATREISLESRDVNCRGKNMLSSIWLGRKCKNRSTAIYLNGEYCKTHCSCAVSGIVCEAYGSPEGIDDCDGDGDGNRIAQEFCTAVRDQFTCSC